MECNKEEAIRAKNIAEKKMQLQDFLGARKIALKAQQLFPDLENIAQMLTVCEVHCAEAIKVNNQENWYDILQVEPTADEHSIKKQYRKLAFLLHPDKNKFAGAESAFKLVGEAQRILLDKASRSVYDLTRKTTVRTAAARTPAQTTSQNSYAAAHGNVPNQQQQSQTSASQTFWTFCPFCGVRYQYYRTTMSRAVRCQNCSKTFIAYDMNARDVPTHVHSNFTTKQSGVPQCNGFSAATTFRTTQASSTMNFQGTTAPGPWSRSRVNSEFCATSGNATNPENQCHDDSKKENEIKFEKVKLEKVNNDVKAAKSSGNAKRKRAKETARYISDDDEHSSFADSSDSDEEIDVEINGCCNVDKSGNQNPRRSMRQKQNVTYTEDQSDDDDNDFVNPPQKSRKCKSSNYSELSDDDVDEVKTSSSEIKGANEEGGEDVLEGTSDATQQVAEDFSYPDPEFYDFGKDRQAHVFAVGQIWALYDDLDGMPRFYVKISEILVQDFKVTFSWFEHNPQDQSEEEWSAAGLPVACGNFKVGEIQSTENLDMFSHIISIENNKRKRKFSLIPTKGQIWALYKGWDMQWSSIPEKCKSFDYEIVEILSEDAEGVDVVRLIKVTGFVSLFARGLHNSILHIPHSETLRFSHMIPSHRMSGKEQKGVPEGSHELDPAALPFNFGEKFPSVCFEDINSKNEESEVEIINEAKPSNLKHGTCRVDVSENNDSGSRSIHLDGKSSHMDSLFRDPNAGSSSITGMPDSMQKEKLASSSTRSHKPLENGKESHPMFSGSNSRTQFHNFESDRSFDEIAKCQVWALYSNLDGFPRDYAYVRDVQKKYSKVHITRLEACPNSDWQKRWHDKNLPVACGGFKLSSGKGSRLVLDTLATFSHLVKYELGQTKNQYSIYPHVGEVWALYRNWSTEWEESNIKKCLEYDLVEVLSVSSSIVVKLLEKNGSYKAVFVPKVCNGQSCVLEMPITELPRFSHRIPSFRLSEGNGGQLNDCWELDPVSLPGASLHPNCS